jgi:hypothetical protein
VKRKGVSKKTNLFFFHRKGYGKKCMRRIKGYLRKRKDAFK